MDHQLEIMGCTGLVEPLDLGLDTLWIPVFCFFSVGRELPGIISFENIEFACCVFPFLLGFRLESISITI